MTHGYQVFIVLCLMLGSRYTRGESQRWMMKTKQERCTFAIGVQGLPRVMSTKSKCETSIKVSLKLDLESLILNL